MRERILVLQKTERLDRGLEILRKQALDYVGDWATLLLPQGPRPLMLGTSRAS